MRYVLLLSLVVMSSCSDGAPKAHPTSVSRPYATTVPVDKTKYQPAAASDILKKKDAISGQMVTFRIEVISNGPLKPEMGVPFGFTLSPTNRNMRLPFGDCPKDVKRRFDEATLVKVTHDPGLDFWEDAYAFIRWTECPGDLGGKLKNREFECGDRLVVWGTIDKFVQDGPDYRLFSPVALVKVDAYEIDRVLPRTRLPAPEALKSLGIVRGITVHVIHGYPGALAGQPPPKKAIEPTRVPGVSVFFRGKGRAKTIETTSDQFGELVIALPEGEYEVTWTMPYERDDGKAHGRFTERGWQFTIPVTPGKEQMLYFPVVEMFVD